MHFSKPLILLAGLESLAQAAIFSADADKDLSVWGRSTSSPAANEHKARRRVVRNRNLGSRQSGWNPPADLAAPLKEVWDHTLETYNNGQALEFTNYGWDQLKANNGYVRTAFYLLARHVGSHMDKMTNPVITQCP